MSCRIEWVRIPVGSCVPLLRWPPIDVSTSSGYVMLPTLLSVNRQTTVKKKHYLPATTVAGGNKAKMIIVSN